MVTQCSDSQTVSETESTLFTLIQAPPVSALLILKNSGVNTMNYRFQSWSGSAWVDMGASGSDLYTTLSANEVKTLLLSSSAAKVQLVGNASGGAFLEFTVSRYFDRQSGGPIPLLNL